MLRKLLDVLSPDYRRRFLRLFPLMVIASLFEVLIVGMAAGFFSLLSNPAQLQGDGRFGRLFAASGLEEAGFLIAFGCGLVAVLVCGNVYASFVNHKVYELTWSQVASLSTRVLSSFLNRPYEYHLLSSPSDLTHRTIQDVQDVIGRMVVAGTVVLVRSVSAVVLALYLFIDEPMTTAMMVLAVGSLYGAAFLALRRILKRIGRTTVLANRARQRLALEAFNGVKEIKLGGLETVAQERYATPVGRFASQMALQQTVGATSKYILEIAAVGGLVLVVVAFLGIGRSVEEILPVVATFGIAAFRLLPTFQVFFQTLSNMQVYLFALDKVHSALSGAPPLEVQNVPSERVALDRKLEIRELHYRYPNTDDFVIRDVDLTLPRGSWTALVGTTGAGKSTLVDLMMGLLQPTSGTVQVDDTLLDSPESVRGWQQTIGYVPQMMFVSDDTIAANIAFGDPAPDLDRVKHAARLAALSDFVEGELPDSYQTRVGDRGTRLSGGQRQRMGIARALYRQPSVLVLDEATSALDNETEAQVMADLKREFADTTVIMIAHRLTTTRHCDRIIVLDAGQIIDSGTYDELLERSFLFRRMVEASQGDAPPDAPESGPVRQELESRTAEDGVA
jgi:ATP-binding cassette subfamily C protein